MSDESAATKPPKHRSPSYPAIDLKAAVHRAQQVSALAGRHAASVASVAEAWGYSPKSSRGLLAIAALKKYGLATDEGSGENRVLQLTQLGRELAFQPDDPGDGPGIESWRSAARSAALKPSIHAELWEKYGGELPDDRVIRRYLILERGFNESAATEVLTVFRSTLDYAGFSEPPRTPAAAGDRLSEEGDVRSVASLEGVSSAAGFTTGSVSTGSAEPGLPRERTGTLAVGDSAGRASRAVQIPYSPGEWAVLQAAFPLTEADWQSMMAVLQAMKPGLVRGDDPQG